MYVIRNIDNGKFVADMSKSRDGQSYTRDLLQAKIFREEAEAKANVCPGNEHVVRVEKLLR